MPSTISKRTTRNGGKNFAKTKKTIKGAHSQRWTNALNGKSVIVDTRVRILPKTKKLLRAAGILVDSVTSQVPAEGDQIEALLKGMGAVKLTPEESRRYRHILRPRD